MQSIAPKDKLIVALDLPTPDQARSLVENLGDHVTFYKIGLELLFNGGLDLARQLKANGKNIFLDMKLLDIANTVERAVSNIAELDLDFLTVHGHDLKTLNAAVAGRPAATPKLLAVTVLTNLNEEDLRQQGCQMTPADLVIHRAKLAKQSSFDGVIASGHEAARIRAAVGDDFLIITPGIRLAGANTDDQERVMTPQRAIAAGADYLVVGRPITQADDPAAAAQMFMDEITSAYR